MVLHAAVEGGYSRQQVPALPLLHSSGQLLLVRWCLRRCTAWLQRRASCNWVDYNVKCDGCAQCVLVAHAAMLLCAATVAP